MLAEKILRALKAQQWERCKGELWALVALQDHLPPDTHHDDLRKAVDNFFQDVEHNGLEEE